MYMTAITRTIELLQNSDNSLYTHRSVDEVIATLQAIQTEFEQTGQLDHVQLNLLFAPTSSIQEIAIDNGWGEEFLVLAKECTQTPTA
jgi:hypothetical protein